MLATLAVCLGECCHHWCKEHVAILPAEAACSSLPCKGVKPGYLCICCHPGASCLQRLWLRSCMCLIQHRRFLEVSLPVCEDVLGAAVPTSV